MKNVLGMLKGKGRLDTIENYSILLIAIGAIILTVGTGLTVISSTGIPALLTMVGGLVSFLFTIVLIFSWLAKENMLISILLSSFIISFATLISITGVISMLNLVFTFGLTIVVAGIMIGAYSLITKKLPW